MPVTEFQYAVPVAISGVTSWSGSHTDVDEGTPFNDSDVITSPSNSAISGTTFTITFQLSAATNPTYYADGWALLIRAQKSSAANTQTLLLELLDGATVRHSEAITLTTSMADFTLALTALEAAAISAPAYGGNWFLRVSAPPPTGAGANFVVVSGVALRLPTVGFSHVIPHSSGVGLSVVGAHYGSYLIIDPTGAGYQLKSGSEKAGALYYDGAGNIKVK